MSLDQALPATEPRSPFLCTIPPCCHPDLIDRARTLPPARVAVA